MRVGGKSVGERRGNATNCTHGIATLCPLEDKTYEAEDLLKIKGRENDFSKNEADNILKKIHLQLTIQKLKMGANCPTRRTLNCHWRMVEKAQHGEKFCRVRARRRRYSVSLQSPGQAKAFHFYLAYPGAGRSNVRSMENLKQGERNGGEGSDSCSVDGGFDSLRLAVKCYAFNLSHSFLADFHKG